MPANRKYLIFAAISALLFLIIGLITVKDYGMGWDEVTRWKSGDLKLEYYQLLLKGEQDTLKEQMTHDLYPGLFDLPLSAFNSTFGGDRMLQGHVLSLLFALLGLGATAWLSNVVFGQRTAFLSVLFLILYPNFYGHAMINPKDIPFMATYTLGLAAIVSCAKSLLNGQRPSWGQFIFTGVCIGLAGASRIPGLVLLAIAGGSWAAAIGVAGRFNNKIQEPYRIPILLQNCIGLAITMITSLLVVLVFFPRAQFQLFSSLQNVASGLHSSAKEIPLVFNGIVTDAGHAPFAYAHRFFLISTPVWMLALLLFGFLVLLRSLTIEIKEMDARFFTKLLFLGLAAFPWIYILLTQPDLHNGIRHMLFGVPPLIILMAFGVDYGLDQLKNNRPHLIKASIVLLLAVCLLQLAHLVRLHPYQYVSFNILAGPKAEIPNQYETEYWFTSTKHMLEILPEIISIGNTGPKPADGIPIRVAGPLQAAVPFVPEGFRLVNTFEEATYYIANSTMRTDSFAEGIVIHTIKRDGIPIGVIKKLKGPK